MTKRPLIGANLRPDQQRGGFTATSHLEARPPQDARPHGFRLSAARERGGGLGDRREGAVSERHIIPISGKDSLATAIWQTTHEPDHPYEFVYNDTQAELPETYAWLSLVEKTLGITITRCGKSLFQVIEEQGILPSARTRFCTERSKIRPMNRFIGKDHATVYFGLRADEKDRVGAWGSKKMTPVYPLREAGIGLATVYRIVETRGLMPPAFFWKRLYDAVAARVGSHMSFVEEWPRYLRDRAFAWRSRPNCFFCFFQRLYEWVGLLDHHPDLFAKAEEIEARVGKGDEMRRALGMNWIAEDFPLARIRERAEEIFAARADAVAGIVERSRQTELFGETFDEMDALGTSCGLLCGK